ncbi:unnamed protein product [Linum trigynum]|uniref:Uncharacterized protein n=1 Tax=Linum trigynum TaxID=586398 RepID=A0AAV2G9L0_9ROSI
MGFLLGGGSEKRVWLAVWMPVGLTWATQIDLDLNFRRSSILDVPAIRRGPRLRGLDDVAGRAGCEWEVIRLDDAVLTKCGDGLWAVFA